MRNGFTTRRSIATGFGCMALLAGMLLVRGLHEPALELVPQTGLDDPSPCVVCVLPFVTSEVEIFLPALPAAIPTWLEEQPIFSSAVNILLTVAVRGPPLFFAES